MSISITASPVPHHKEKTQFSPDVHHNKKTPVGCSFVGGAEWFRCHLKSSDFKSIQDRFYPAVPDKYHLNYLNTNKRPTRYHPAKEDIYVHFSSLKPE